MDHVNDLNAFLIEQLKAPFAVLVNRINSYTYAFAAQKNIGNIDQLAAIGIVTYSKDAEIAIQQVDKMHREDPWNMQMFSDRESACDWLVSELEENKFNP